MSLFDLKTVLGKMLVIVMIMVATHFHMLAGVLVVLFVISINQYVIEGMENNGDDSSKESNASKESNKTDDSNGESSVSQFKKSNCVGGTLMKDGKKISNDLIKDSFPNLKFIGDTCNPCDDECKFEIISSVERLTNEENLRGEDSTTQPINREQAIQKK